MATADFVLLTDKAELLFLFQRDGTTSSVVFLLSQYRGSFNYVLSARNERGTAISTDSFYFNFLS